MKKNVSKLIIAYTDGGSRGNPGPAAIGVVIEGIGEKPKEYCESIGKTTNNVAEYKAIIFALKKIRQLVGKENLKKTKIEIRMDSELAVRQLNRGYKVENKEIQLLFMEIWNLRFDFHKISFIHIRRDENKLADALLNKCLDRENSKLF